jgi:tetratricopeptide (TPR) repeat protein
MMHAAAKFIPLVILVVTVGCSRRVDPALYSQFEQAQQAFDAARTKQDFVRVAGMYDQILRSGVQSGAVFYNRGNAYMRAGQRGRAIASYRQAQRYRPRDPLLDANLRSALQGKESVGTSRPLIEYILFWQNWISYPAKFQASIVTSLAAFVLGTIGLLNSHVIWRRLAFVTLLVSLAITASAIYDWYRFDHVGHGVVVVPEAVARKGNADSYEPAFTAPLVEGTEFVVLEKRGDWLRAHVHGSQEGWLRAVDVVEY